MGFGKYQQILMKMMGKEMENIIKDTKEKRKKKKKD
jgi:hypothetical protein